MLRLIYVQIYEQFSLRLYYEFRWRIKFLYFRKLKTQENLKKIVDYGTIEKFVLNFPIKKICTITLYYIHFNLCILYCTNIRSSNYIFCYSEYMSIGILHLAMKVEFLYGNLNILLYMCGRFGVIEGNAVYPVFNLSSNIGNNLY